MTKLDERTYKCVADCEPQPWDCDAASTEDGGSKKKKRRRRSVGGLPALYVVVGVAALAAIAFGRTGTCAPRAVRSPDGRGPGDGLARSRVGRLVPPRINSTPPPSQSLRRRRPCRRRRRPAQERPSCVEAGAPGGHRLLRRRPGATVLHCVRGRSRARSVRRRGARVSGSSSMFARVGRERGIKEGMEDREEEEGMTQKRRPD